MSMTLFLMALDCQYFAVPADVKGYNQEFPAVYCWTMPHLAREACCSIAAAVVWAGVNHTSPAAAPDAFVAVISLIVFILMAGAFTLGEMVSHCRAGLCCPLADPLLHGCLRRS